MALWTEHREPLVADFWRYYGAGFDQLLDAGVPITDVADMAAHLPRDSATMLAVSPKQEIELWQVTDYLLATVADLLASANWQRAGKKGAPRPKPIKRPKVNTRSKRTVTKEQIKAWEEWYAAQPGGRRKTADN